MSSNKGRRAGISPISLIGLGEAHDDVIWAKKQYKAASTNEVGHASVVVNDITAFWSKLNRNTRLAALLAMFGTFNTQLISWDANIAANW